LHNAQDSITAGTHVSLRGSGNAILNKRKAGEIKWLLSNTHKSNREVGVLYGVGPHVISRIRYGWSWISAEPIEPPQLPTPKRRIK
jgi:hypothetical protein